jgi:AcrR family transcriptional regulator
LDTAETRQRILAAAAELHAKHGIKATTYAMIAAHADVAVPTVYNHFPTLDGLQAACGGEIMAKAPALGIEIFAGAEELSERIEALARAINAFYRFVAPWWRWTFYESRLLAELEARYKKAAKQRRELLAVALAPAFGKQPPEPLLSLCESVIDFPSWERLTGEYGLDDVKAAQAISDGLLALAESQLVPPGARAAPRRGALPSKQ